MMTMMVRHVGKRCSSSMVVVRSASTRASNARVDTIHTERCQQLAATLGWNQCPAEGPAPLFSHWTSWQTHCPLTDTGLDGHPRRGGPYDLSIQVPDDWRRMFGGSVLLIGSKGAPRLGQRLSRESRIEDVVDKPHATAPLKLCTNVHEYRCTETQDLALVEKQTIIYIAPREGPPPPKAPRLPTPGAIQPKLDELCPTPTLLFRYSALTFNSHRIHYDLRYCQDVEGYDDLVVHGPLMATLLGKHARDLAPPNSRVSNFSWRALEPVLCSERITLHGGLVQGLDERTIESRLYVQKEHGGMAVEATVQYSIE